MSKSHAASAQTPDVATVTTAAPRTITSFTAAQPSVLLLRDGEVVLYRRTRSLMYQCRFKLADGKWHRCSTRKASLENAIAAACDRYDEARYRQRLGLAHRTHSFVHIAQLTLAVLRRQIDASKALTAFHSYATCIEKYFLPYFGERMLEDLTRNDIVEFELWRDRQMARTPKASTLNNFTSAWNKVIATAVEHGYISERVPAPKLSNKGLKGKTRPAFTEVEINTLLVFMETWQLSGIKAIEREMRPLLRDYVEMLLLTGMRHGTEAMGICSRHLEWHTDKGVRYLRVWVDGKTGGRLLIAKHRAVDVLRRLHARQKDVNFIAFEHLFVNRVAHKLFRTSTGFQPSSLNGSFRRLLRDTGLLIDEESKNALLIACVTPTPL